MLLVYSIIVTGLLLCLIAALRIIDNERQLLLKRLADMKGGPKPDPFVTLARGEAEEVLNNRMDELEMTKGRVRDHYNALMHAIAENDELKVRYAKLEEGYVGILKIAKEFNLCGVEIRINDGERL